jgi:predicted dehydrogenase
MRVKVAIVGAGGIAEAHADILKKIPQVRLACVCDSAPRKAEVFARKLGVPDSCPSLGDLLESSRRPDVVHVATPPTAHASNAVDCLNAGVGVFVEKPFATSAEECEKIRRAAAQSGAPVGVNHNLTFHPAVLRLIDVVRNRRLGALEHVAVCYNMPMPVASGPYSHWLFRGTGNLMFELGPHPLSLIQRLLGPILSVTTLPSGEMRLPSGVRFFHTWQTAMQCERGTASLYLSVGGDYLDTAVWVEAEDGAAHIDLRRNTLRVSEKSHLMRPNDDLRHALGAAASLVRDGIRNYRDYILSSLRRPAPYPASYAAMDGSIRAFYAALSRGGRPPASLEDGTAVVRACELATAPVLESSFANHGV